jgi:acyl carrier protein
VTTTRRDDESAIEPGSAEPIDPEMVTKAVQAVLDATRPGDHEVRPATPLQTLELESLDLVEIFMLIEDWTGAVFDLSHAPPRLELVRDLAGYPQVLGLPPRLRRDEP